MSLCTRFAYEKMVALNDIVKNVMYIIQYVRSSRIYKCSQMKKQHIATVAFGNFKTTLLNRFLYI